jgi:hypothetical protein
MYFGIRLKLVKPICYIVSSIIIDSLSVCCALLWFELEFTSVA